MSRSKQIAIIGSGPISLFEALYQAKLGNQVVIFEQKENIGGAWSTVQYDDGEDYEVGCHIWDVHKKSYRFLEQFLDDKLTPLQPSPNIIYKNNKFPYDWKNNIILLKLLKNNFKGYLSIRKYIKPVIIKRKYFYPKGGSAQLIKQLKYELISNRVEVRLDSEVKGLKKINNSWELQESSRTHFFDRIIVSSMSMIKEISFDEQNFVLKHKETVFTHFHLIIKGKTPNPISYIRVMGHRFIHRISDISSYSNNKNYVFSIGVFNKKIDINNEDEIVESIFLFLKKNKFVSKDSEVIRFFKNDYTASHLDKEQSHTLRNIDNSLTLLKSTNFIYGISDNLEKWSEEF